MVAEVGELGDRCIILIIVDSVFWITIAVATDERELQCR